MGDPERKKKDDIYVRDTMKDKQKGTVCTGGRKLGEFVSTYEKMKASSFSYHHEKPWPYKW